jgi:hypothetical protein
MTKKFIYDNPIEISADGVMSVSNSMVSGVYDYIGMTYQTTTDTIVYKSGGASGTTVATVTITYQDASKAVVTSVAKT